MPLTPLGSVAQRLPARDGTSILVRRWVAPGRPHTYLVLVHDVHEDTTAWDRWARGLQDSCVDVEGFDLRGRGGSEGRLRWADLLDDLEDRVNATRSRAGGKLVAIHGHGVGATLALDYAISGRAEPDAYSVWAPLGRLLTEVAEDAPRRGIVAAIRSGFTASGFGNELKEAAARVTDLAASVTQPVRVTMSWPDGDARLAIPPQRFKDWSMANDGHDLHRGEWWESRRNEVSGWLQQQARTNAPDDTPAPFRHTVNEDLTRKEARALFREHVASEPARLAEFEQAVLARGGPPPVCGRPELVALGAWLIDALEEGEPSGPEPRWAAHWRRWSAPEARLDTSTMWLLDGLAAHIARCYRTLRPDLDWELDTHKSSITYQEPVLGHLVSPGPARNAISAARGDPPNREWLGPIWDQLEKYAAAYREQTARGVDQADGPGEIMSLAGVSVGPYDGPDYDVGIWIPEQAEMAIGEEAFASLDQRIAALPGVAGLAWEDRELMYAKLAAGTSPDQLREAIVELLDADIERLRAVDDEE